MILPTITIEYDEHEDQDEIVFVCFIIQIRFFLRFFMFFRIQLVYSFRLPKETKRAKNKQNM